MSNSQQVSEDFLNSIKTIENIPCFVKINDSNFVVVAIHQHLGLVQNFTDILCKFVQDDASIIIPDLFCNIQLENIDENDQFACFTQLSISEVHLILKKCISYAQAKNKIIILMGFSVGAALGLKLIEKLKGVSMGMFFYGYPSVKSLEPRKINCPIVIFHAQKDQIKHLSDNDHFNQVLKAYEKQQNFNIQKIDSSHGFMNHQHPNYDQISLKYCRKIFHQYLVQIEKNDNKPQQIQHEKEKETNKKEDEGACKLY